MPESIYVAKSSTGSFSAAGFQPSGDQTGLTADTDLEMMVQTFQDDADWTVTSNTQLTANRTGRYRFSGMWTFARTAGAVNDSFSVDLFRNNAITIQQRAIIYPDDIGVSGENVSACMVISALINQGDILETRVLNITTNTYSLIAAESSLLIERMRT